MFSNCREELHYFAIKTKTNKTSKKLQAENKFGNFQETR